MPSRKARTLYGTLLEMLLAVVVMAGLASPTALAQNYLFGKVDLATDLNSPIAVAAADFNRDGKPDLAVVNENCAQDANFQIVCDVGSVSIFLTKADGTFRPRVDYATRKNPTSLTVGDFNGDRKLDLAVADRSSDGVSILLGNGDGTFQPEVKYAAGRAPQTMAQGDFNQRRREARPGGHQHRGQHGGGLTRERRWHLSSSDQVSHGSSAVRRGHGGL